MSFEPGRGDRVVVISPHLDDGVLSLGGAAAAWVRRGTDVVMLTVLGCDPDSAAPAGGWDDRAGFASEGEAARARRREDLAACAILGVVAEWLPFGSSDYERHGDDDAVRAAVAARLARTDSVILPGTPLTHPDHSWLTRLLLGRPLPCERIGLYAEQPYRSRGDGASAPDWLSSLGGSTQAFDTIRVGWRERRAKARAIRCYRSQLPLLGLGRRGGWRLGRVLLAEARAGGEAVAWLGERR